jgi:hypothetical protein
MSSTMMPHPLPRTDLYHGLFRWQSGPDGQPLVARHAGSPAEVPCPTTGRLLRVATLDASAAAICPSCEGRGQGGFVSFVGDLRMAYACPQCLQLVWLQGA